MGSGVGVDAAVADVSCEGAGVLVGVAVGAAAEGEGAVEGGEACTTSPTTM